MLFKLLRMINNDQYDNIGVSFLIFVSHIDIFVRGGGKDYYFIYHICTIADFLMNGKSFQIFTITVNIPRNRCSGANILHCLYTLIWFSITSEFDTQYSMSVFISEHPYRSIGNVQMLCIYSSRSSEMQHMSSPAKNNRNTVCREIMAVHSLLQS